MKRFQVILPNYAGQPVVEAQKWELHKLGACFYNWEGRRLFGSWVLVAFYPTGSFTSVTQLQDK